MATSRHVDSEPVVLSLGTADRSRRIRRELDESRQRREIDMAETKTLRLAAHTDFLTGLGNRAAFQHQANALMKASIPFSLFLIDVDYLKDVNDRMGHASGDMLLCHVGAALGGVVHSMADVRVSRIGGDQFAILCPGSLHDEAAPSERIVRL